MAEFTVDSLISLAFFSSLWVVAVVLSSLYLPPYTPRKDRLVFLWCASDALIHYILEGSFLYMSFPPHPMRSVNMSSGLFATMWKQYAMADKRWGESNEVVVSLEILTVFGCAPICTWICYCIVRKDMSRHFWIVILSTAELYGGWMTVCISLYAR